MPEFQPAEGGFEMQKAEVRDGVQPEFLGLR